MSESTCSHQKTEKYALLPGEGNVRATITCKYPLSFQLCRSTGGGLKDYH